jgi:transposase-like protein
MKTKTGTKDRRGRILRSAEDRRELIERYKASGLSKAEFCGRHGLKLTTLYGWMNSGGGKVRRRTRSPRRRVKFAQMEVALGKAAPIEIELPSRVCIRLREASSVGDLVKFVREVGVC